MIKVEFLQDFATKKKGEVWGCSSMLACSLIRRGVAKKATEKVVKEEKQKRGRPKKDE